MELEIMKIVSGYAAGLTIFVVYLYFALRKMNKELEEIIKENENMDKIIFIRDKQVERLQRINKQFMLRENKQ